ncbi:MAG TPA: prolyl oligopeptidase family serine peptidase [Chthonomonadaceae bacterium]|nr:prolyl oligopeptidase family serine peptidase [Chthonomonadaceae bacterium]
MPARDVSLSKLPEFAGKDRFVKKRMRVVFLAAVLSLAMRSAAGTAGQAASSPPPLEVTLPSAAPSGNPIVDRIWLTFYPAVSPTGAPAPAVVVLHVLGEEAGTFRLIQQFGRYLAQHGIGAAVMTLPYHMRRLPPHDFPMAHFLSADLSRVYQAFDQSASDVSTVVTWLQHQPSVDPNRIGVVGVSLGAIVGHLAMGLDSRLTAGVAILGGGDIEGLYHRSLLVKVEHPHLPRNLPARDRILLARIDPITYADRNRPRHVLMIEAARDFLLPPSNATLLWNALGRPPIEWLDTNHYAPVFVARSLMRASAAYLDSVWSGAPPRVMRLSVPTVKLGMLAGLDSVVTPAIQWQVIELGIRRDHMSLFNLNIGWSGRGPFVGLAATLNAYMDLGIGHRFNGKGVRPYLSFHLVF